MPHGDVEGYVGSMTHNFPFVEEEVDQKVQGVCPEKWKSGIKGWHSDTKKYQSSVSTAIACGNLEESRRT